jgi:asparagine synthase (glutamine-hydrolysing)
VCGICGVVSRNGAPLRRRDALQGMRETLAHRGPDGAAGADFLDASLQIRRLAIIDLAHGDQPFTSPDGKVAIVCNGEIYNATELRRDPAALGYPFRSRSDVESILPLYLAYGDACVERLEGMFALAIWDARKRRLLLARDRTGEKPLFYASVGNEVVFASETKALLAYPRLDATLDPVAVATFLALGYVLHPRTMRRAVRSLPPGCRLVADASGVRVEAYWRAEAQAAPASGAPPDLRSAAREVRDALEQAVARELMSDVPVGVFLSGGLDSSLLAALAARHFDPRGIFTYTVSFGDPSYDESGPASLVATRLQTAHSAVPCDRWNLRRALGIVTEQMDEPLGDPAILPTYLLSEAARRDVKVILSGEGADELFGGYPTYLGHRAAGAYARLPASARNAFSRAVMAWPSSPGKVTIEFLLKRFVTHAAMPPLARHFEWFGAMGLGRLDDFLGPAAAAGLDQARAELQAKGEVALAGRKTLDGVMLLDFLTYLPDDLLVKVDRASMMASVEARAPFLDRQVVELALGLPATMKVRRLQTKAVLKEAARTLLPPEIVGRRKRGLSVPIAAWMNEELRAEVDRAFDAQRLRAEGWIRPEAVRPLLDEHRAGTANHARRLWPVFMFQRWLERWGAARDREDDREQLHAIPARRWG